MKAPDILIPLGYVVGSRVPQTIPAAHMLTIGMTQQAGKTTAMLGLASRAQKDLRFIVFATKRGEDSFEQYPHIQPYFHENADWQYVLSLLQTVTKEKLGIHRSFIMNVTRGTKTLGQVHANVLKKLEKLKGGLAEGIYTELDAYLKLVIPQIKAYKFAPNVVIKKGINVVDLREFSPEMQMLIMRSMLEWINENETKVISVIPEAWSMLPQGKTTPVRDAIEAMIRKGAVLQNYVWADTQDTAGIDNLMLRAARVWLFGVQRQRDEIKRSSENVPPQFQKELKKYLPTLQLGEFYVAYDNTFKLVYVQPEWMSNTDAMDVAEARDFERTEIIQSIHPIAKQIDSDTQLIPLAAYAFSETGEDEKETDEVELEDELDPEDGVESWLEEDDMSAHDAQMAQEAEEEGEDEEEMDLNKLSQDRLLELKEEIENLLFAENGGNKKAKPAQKQQDTVNANGDHSAGLYDLDAVYKYVVNRIQSDPKAIHVLKQVPHISVEIQTITLEVDSKTLRGAIALLILKGFFDNWTKGARVLEELNVRQNNNFAKVAVYTELNQLFDWGFLEKNEAKEYLVVPSMKANLIKKTKGK